MCPIFVGSVHNFGFLRMKLFSEKMLISNKWIIGLMSNLIKKSWKVSNLHFPRYFPYGFQLMGKRHELSLVKSFYV